MNPWIRIARPPIMLISVLGAFVGAALATTPYGLGISFWQCVWIAVGATAFSSALMIQNDIYDEKSDRTTRPDKPIPSGAIDPETASMVALILYIVALVVSLSLSMSCAGLTLVIVLLGWWYNTSGKGAGVLGAASVSIGVGAIPLWGALAVRPEEPWLMIPLFLSLVAAELGREIMVSTGDFQGDVVAGWRTVPVCVGRIEAMWFALAFYVLSIPLWVWCYFAIDGFGWMYVVAAGVFLGVLLVGWCMCYQWVDIARQPKPAAFKAIDEKYIFASFETWLRWGSRIAIMALQVVMLAEAFL